MMPETDFMTCSVLQPAVFKAHPRLSDQTEGACSISLRAAGQQRVSMAMERSWGLRGYLFYFGLWGGFC